MAFGHPQDAVDRLGTFTLDALTAKESLKQMLKAQPQALCLPQQGLCGVEVSLGQSLQLHRFFGGDDSLVSKKVDQQRPGQTLLSGSSHNEGEIDKVQTEAVTQGITGIGRNGNEQPPQ